METEYIYETDFGQGGGDHQGQQQQQQEETAAAVAGIAGHDEGGGEIIVGDHHDGTLGAEMMVDHSDGIVDGGHIISGDQIPIVTAPPHMPNLDVEISQEDELKSQERLDRSSPDLWPQNLASAAQHVIAKNSLKSGEPEQPLGIWAQGLDPEDVNLLHQFGSLTSSSLVEEVKKLQNIAYQLGLEEAKEMTRGKLLHVLDGDDDDLAELSREKRRHVQRLWK